MIKGIAAFLAGVAVLALAAPAAAGTIHVEVAGLRNNRGSVACALFVAEASAASGGSTEAKGFPQAEAALARVKVAAAPPASVCAFHDVQAGRYAVLVLHDENDNGKMDRSWFLGIPLEGYGVSNNKTYPNRAPVFEEATFLVDLQPAYRLIVKLRY